MHLLLNDARGNTHGIFRRQRAIGFNRQDQLVIIRTLANAGRFHAIGHAAHRRINRIHRDQTNRRIFRTIFRGRHIALAGIDDQFHGKLRAIIQRANHQIRIGDFDIAGGLDLPRGHFTRTSGHQRQALFTFTLIAERKLLHIQHNIGDVFAHARNAAEFMQHAINADCLHRRTKQRGKQHAAQRIAKRHAEATFQRLQHQCGAAQRVDRRLDMLLRLDQGTPVAVKHVHVSPIGLRRSGVARVSDAAALARAATVMGNGGHIANRSDLKANSLQSTQSRFTARTRAAHHNVQHFHPVFTRLAARIFSGNLRRVRGGFAAALEALRTRRRPSDGIALRISDRHDGIVEGGQHMRNTGRDVLPFLALYRATSGTAAGFTSHLTWSPSSCRR